MNKYNAILQENLNQKGGKGKLAGKKIVVKANICVKGLNVSCASKVLENSYFSIITPSFPPMDFSISKN